VTSSQAEPLQLPVTEGDFWPISYVDSETGQLDGSMVRIIHELFERAGIDHEVVTSPKERLRRGFVRCAFPVICCVNPDWRTRPEEVEVQLFSDQLYSSDDIFIFPVGKRFDLWDWSILREKSIAIVRGYGYVAEPYFGVTMDLPTQEHVVNFVSAGRADIGIVDRFVFDRLKPGRVVPGPVHHAASLHVRVHKDHADLLDKLNPHIAEMRQTNRVQAIRQEFFAETTRPDEGSGSEP
jgi:hypothetical protein